LWAPVNFASFATHFDVNEYSSGERWHETGFIVPDGGSSPREMKKVVYRSKLRAGTRWAESCSIDLIDHDDAVSTVELTPLFEFHMTGIGYGNKDWGHGHWKGELAVGLERWNLPVEHPCDPSNLHIQAICRATMGAHTGIGILEQLIIGPHEPSALTGMIDPAR